MTDRPTIYTVGDSHGWKIWLDIRNVKANYVHVAMTMHSFAESVTRDDKFLNVIPMDGIICFCHGEIDCRCYVHDHQPWNLEIDRLVSNYLHAIDLCTAGRNKNLIWIYTIVPPIRNAIEASGFPFRGTIDERITYAKYMNKKLKESKYTFIDLYEKYSDTDGSMKDELGDAHCHVNNPTILTDWIENRSYNELSDMQ